MPSKAMFKRYGLITISMFMDMAIFFVAYAIATSLRMLAAASFVETNIIFVVLSGLYLITIFSLLGIYRRIWSKTSGHDVIHIIKATGFALVTTAMIFPYIEPRPLPISVFLSIYFIALTGFIMIRYRSRLIGAFKWRYRAIWFHEFPDFKRVIIIGAGDSGQNTALHFRKKFNEHHTHYRVIGFLDDDLAKLGMIIENCPVLGTISDVETLVEKHRIDLIVVAIHNIDGPNFRRILTLCENTNARIKVVPDVFGGFEAKTASPPLRDVTAEDLIGRRIVTKHKDVDLSPILNRKILVTGAAGSIGSEIAEQILDYDPQHVILLDNNESALHDLTIKLKAVNEHIQITPCLIDVSHCDNLETVMRDYQPDIVFHAAAYKHVPMLESFPNEAVRVNIGGTLNLVELAIKYHVERFVLVSTDKAVEPVSVMGASKRVCEMIVHAMAQEYSTETLFGIVRFGNVLGSRGSVVPIFNRQIDAGGPITITDSRMTRYFMSIPEATNLVIHAAAMTTGDDVFVLRMGEVVKIVDLAERMIRLRGLRPYTDIPIEFVGIRPGEKLHEELYELNENPQITQHPYITRIGSAHLNGQSPDLITRVTNLIRNGITDDTRALEELKQIIASFEPTVLH